MKVMVIAAHPDDEVLGCGGAIARLASEGHPCNALIVGEGITSRHLHREDADLALLAAHQSRAQEAGRLLGVSEVKILGFPDQRLDQMPFLELVHSLEREIDRIRPEWIFTQHGGDLNLDHALVFRATMTASRPMAGGNVRRLLAFETASATEWAFGQFAPVFQPDTFFDITSTLERKLSAIQVYESETRAYPHPRSPEALTAQARRWGSVVGVAAAEAFRTVWEVR